MTHVHVASTKMVSQKNEKSQNCILYENMCLDTHGSCYPFCHGSQPELVPEVSFWNPLSVISVGEHPPRQLRGPVLVGLWFPVTFNETSTVWFPGLSGFVC